MRHYNEYCKLIPTDPEKGKSAEIIKQSQTNEEKLDAPKTEKQITHPKTDDERIAEGWFENLKRTPVVRRMIEFVLSERPEMQKVQIMNSIRDHIRKTGCRSELDAAKWIVDNVGIEMPLELLRAYKHRKDQTSYEQRPGVHEARLERRKKQRTKSRQSSN